MIQATAPGKMILLGEYAVLEGAPALVCAVNRRASVRIRVLKGNEFRVHSPSLQSGIQPFILTPHLQIRFDPQLNPLIAKRLLFFKDIFESVLNGIRAYGTLPAMELELQTDDFYSQELHRKLGFGSSSALTTALTKGMVEAAGLEIPTREIFTLALKAHRAAQGKAGSGIDIAACTYGGVLQYTMEREPIEIEPWKELPFAVIWTGASASTSQMVRRVSAFRREAPALFHKLIRQLTTISERGINAYRERALGSFLAAAQSYYETLRTLGEESSTSIISPAHKTLARMAHRHGAVYKPSGAGGGDIGLLFTSSFEELETLREKITELGFQIVAAEIASEGVLVTK